ncbi:DUF4843 domain-containing protein [Sphingobacterium faecale]|uniref:DUF4843 domain-containing protein n=1 Tax=Sphingobacterium faecale TaxID=2803775 RepID=A0ABS1R5Q9_9SPHI|nr:DUF4843 domain-containing protein [Sphingobacterium faecale]MBL1410038.1 DUF4843 domain-containing protein [Sphingobacterium faecale]
MKNLIFYAATFVTLIQISCTKDLPLYSDDQDKLIFLHGEETGSVILPSVPSSYVLAHTFVYGTQNTDTLYVKLKTIGFIRNSDRPIELEQVLTGENDADPDVHFTALTADQYKKNYIIPAGSTTASLPIIVHREASLKNRTVNLKLRIKDNGVFRAGYESRSELLITITDALSKPANWNSAATFYFGNYGKVKHQFMIDASGEAIDEKYMDGLGFATVGFYNEKFDGDYVTYINGIYKRKLNEENQRRAAMTPALSPLQEENKTVVSFP